MIALTFALLALYPTVATLLALLVVALLAAHHGAASHARMAHAYAAPDTWTHVGGDDWAELLDIELGWPDAAPVAHTPQARRTWAPRRVIGRSHAPSIATRRVRGTHTHNVTRRARNEACHAPNARSVPTPRERSVPKCSRGLETPPHPGPPQAYG